MTRVEKGPGWELRLGRWQDVIGADEWDAVITDPPYGARTHEGHNELADQVQQATGQKTLERIEYGSMTHVDVVELVAVMHKRTRGWMAFMTSHDLIPVYESAAHEMGRYPFAPLPIIQKRPRLLGDGPSSWAVYMMVSRPRTRDFSTWGTLPGAYFAPTVKGMGIAGCKPVSLMREIVRHYSRPGDCVLDPFAGSGSTLIAAVAEGRTAIGCEVDPRHFDIALANLRRGITTTMFPE